jgi:hypothetical protein
MPEKLAGDRPLKIPDWSVETYWRFRVESPVFWASSEVRVEGVISA